MNQIPTVDGTYPYAVGDTGENLQLYLSAIGDEVITDRIGREQVLFIMDGVTITRGETFTNRSSTVTGGRYLVHNIDNEIIGALNYTKTDKPDLSQTVISNIYVRRDYRRRGVASHLIQTLQKNEANVVVDSSMTRQGGLLFGYPEKSRSLKL